MAMKTAAAGEAPPGKTNGDWKTYSKLERMELVAWEHRRVNGGFQTNEEDQMN